MGFGRLRLLLSKIKDGVFIVLFGFLIILGLMGFIMIADQGLARSIKCEGLCYRHALNGVTCKGCHGKRLVEYVYSPDRIKYPLKREGNKWSKISYQLLIEEQVQEREG